MGEQNDRPLLRAAGLVTRQNGVGCSFTLKTGNRLGVLGASGSGKTAFLRTLASLKAPVDGQLYWNGVSMTRKSRWSMGKRRFLGKRRFFVALLFTNPYTSLEPWELVRQFLGRSHRPTEAQVGLLQESLIPAVAATGYVKSLSGVGRVHLALTYALQNDPSAVLVDDVFRMIVPEVWEQLYAEVDVQVGDMRGLIVASRFWQALEHTHHVLVLYKGSVVEWGPRASVFSEPRHPYTQWLLEQRTYSRMAFAEMGARDLDTDVVGKHFSEPREVTPGHWVR